MLLCYAPPLIGMSVAYIGPKSRTERPRKTKVGTEVAHVTRDSDTTFKVKRSRSPGRFAHRRVGASGGCSGGRDNVLAVGNCCYVAVCSAAQGASAPTGEGEGRRHTVTADRLQVVVYGYELHCSMRVLLPPLRRFCYHRRFFVNRITTLLTLISVALKLDKLEWHSVERIPLPRPC